MIIRDEFGFLDFSSTAVNIVHRYFDNVGESASGFNAPCDQGVKFRNLDLTLCGISIQGDYQNLAVGDICNLLLQNLDLVEVVVHL